MWFAVPPPMRHPMNGTRHSQRAASSRRQTSTPCHRTEPSASESGTLQAANLLNSLRNDPYTVPSLERARTIGGHGTVPRRDPRRNLSMRVAPASDGPDLDSRSVTIDRVEPLEIIRKRIVHPRFGRPQPSARCCLVPIEGVDSNLCRLNRPNPLKLLGNEWELCT